MRIGVTGPNGRLGSELVRRGCIPIKSNILSSGLGYELDSLNLDLIINCAAYTDVDLAEINSNISKVSSVNISGLALLNYEFSGRMIHISTDYVFDGVSGPYKENAAKNPLGVYGKSKSMGEDLLIDLEKNRLDYNKSIIVRTTVLYDEKTPNFVTKLLRQLDEGTEVKVTKRISGTPTYIPHLVDGLLKLAKMMDDGFYTPIIHIAGKGVLTRYEFALSIANMFGFDPTLVIPTIAIPGKAVRPLRAGLRTEYAQSLGIPVYSVFDGLKDLKRRVDASVDLPE